jgi:hypothetical protein
MASHQIPTIGMIAGQKPRLFAVNDYFTRLATVAVLVVAGAAGVAAVGVVAAAVGVGVAAVGVGLLGPFSALLLEALLPGGL